MWKTIYSIDFNLLIGIIGGIVYVENNIFY